MKREKQFKKNWERKMVKQEAAREKELVFKPKTNQNADLLRENYQNFHQTEPAPFQINSVYSTNIGKTEDLKSKAAKANPNLVVQRLYETSSAWKEKRKLINDLLIAKEATFKPVIYSKQP